MQHLRECRSGDTSGPAAWRSSWAAPRALSPHAPPLAASLALGSGGGARRQRPRELRGGPGAVLGRGMSAGEEGDALDADSLEQELQLIVADAMERQEHNITKGQSNLVTGQPLLPSRSPSPNMDACGVSEGDDDDMDLGALLSKRI
jgi:hypothetical protein